MDDVSLQALLCLYLASCESLLQTCYLKASPRRRSIHLQMLPELCFHFGSHISPDLSQQLGLELSSQLVSELLFSSSLRASFSAAKRSLIWASTSWLISCLNCVLISCLSSSLSLYLTVRTRVTFVCLAARFSCFLTLTSTSSLISSVNSALIFGRNLSFFASLINLSC